jgi:phage terminase small subunit
MAEQKLTPKQKKFVKEYQKDLNGTQAAKRAGYSKKTAGAISSENLQKPQIVEAINKDIDKTLEKLGISAEWILSGIKEVIERSMQAKPVFTKMGEHAVTEDANGDMATAYQFESGSALKGFELLGKYKSLKIWTDKIEHSGDKENPIVVAPINLEERAALLKKANEK